MRLILIISVFASLFSAPLLKGQAGDITFKGEFNEVSFVDLTREIEEQTGVSFYFREVWIRDIRVSASGSAISLQSTLDRVLLPSGITWFLDEWKHIYLMPQFSMISGLPDYTSQNEQRNEQEAVEESPATTSAEQNYINGRRARVTETKVVGKRADAVGSGNVVIHGRLTDLDSGEPLVGATIYINELRKGAATDVDGRFNLVISPGVYLADCNCMGMEDAQYYLDIRSEGSLAIAMAKNLIPLEEVSVKANRYHNVKGTQMGFERLNYKVFKEIPLVMGERDVINVVKMLPGVQSVGEGASGFNVRGGSADQNMIYVNKVPVYNSSHLFGFFTSFSPEIVRDFTLYKSNLPASLGGRLSSVFDISTKQGNMNRYTARAGISPITGYLTAEGPIRKNRSSFIVSARSTYSDWMLERMEDPELRNSSAGFYDVSSALTFEPGEHTVVKAFGYLSRDRFKLGEANEYAYGNSGSSVNVRHRFSQRTTGDLALVFGQYKFKTIDTNEPSTSYKHEYRISHYELKADFNWLSLGKHRITYGGSAILYKLDRGVVEPHGLYSNRATTDLGIENGVETSIYVADEISLSPRLTVYAGVRLATYLYMGPQQVRLYEPGFLPGDDFVTDTLNFQKGEVVKSYYGIEPRASVNYLLGDNQSLKLSYNRVNQFLFMLSNTIAMAPTDQWKLCDYHISPPFMDQVSFGYYQDFPGKGLSTSLELYRKWIHDVAEYRDGANFIEGPNTETEILQGNQKGYGVEFMLKKNTGKINGWIAYSYSRSFVTVDSPVPEVQINKGLSYPSNHDRPHNFSMVTNYKLGRRVSFSMNMVYTTGRPVTYPVSIYYVDDHQFIHYSDRNRYRIPDYFRLDASLNMEGNLRRRKLFHSFWMLNVYNLTGRRNPYSVYFQSEEGQVNGYKLSIFGQPVVTLSWNVKLGNYASE
jgi:hypothetical protein